MNTLRKLNKFLQILTLVFAVIITATTTICVVQNLPYEGNIYDPDIRDISRLEVPVAEEKLHIFNPQIKCQQQDQRTITCEHTLSDELLSVHVHLQDTKNRVTFDCAASYSEIPVACEAFESIYTHGGLSTPIVIISDDLSGQIPGFEQLTTQYARDSFYNLQHWLKRGIPLLVVLLAIQGLIWFWSVQDRWWRNASRKLAAQTITTVVTSIPAGIFLLFGTVYLLVGLKIVS